MRTRLFFILAGIGFLLSCSTTETGTLNWDQASLVWSDEFEGAEIDTSKWRFETGDHGWGNREWQDYQPFGSDNAFLKDGRLHIVARKVGEGQKAGDYTSARLNSKASFLYGRIEIRAKMPDYKGPGIWPALWTLGDNIQYVGWPTSGEIDILEYVSWRPDSILVTIHSEANNHMNGTQIGSGFVPLPTAEEEFHNYGILWQKDKLQFYVDSPDNVLLSVDRPEDPDQENWPFSDPHYLLMNIAVGGNLGGVEGVDDSIFPATMQIDYVKIWQLNNDK